MEEENFTTPMANQLLSRLDEFQSYTDRLFIVASSSRDSGVNGGTKEQIVASIVEQLIQSETRLKNTLSVYEKYHKPNQKQIQELVQKVEEQDDIWDEAIDRLGDMVDALRQVGAGEEWKVQKEQLQLARQNPLSSRRVLMHAQRLAPFTSAPSSFINSSYNTTVLPAHVRPPFPSETSMRQGRLAASIVRGSVGEITEVVAPIMDEESRRKLEEARESMARRNREAMKKERKRAGAIGFDLDLNPEL